MWLLENIYYDAINHKRIEYAMLFKDLGEMLAQVDRNKNLINSIRFIKVYEPPAESEQPIKKINNTLPEPLSR